MHTENTPVLPTDLESVPHVFPDASIITWRFVATLIIAEMSQTKNSIDNQPRIDAVVIDDQNTATSVQRRRAILQIPLQIHDRHQVASNIGDAADPWLGTWDFR